MDNAPSDRRKMRFTPPEDKPPRRRLTGYVLPHADQPVKRPRLSGYSVPEQTVVTPNGHWLRPEMPIYLDILTPPFT